MQQLLCCPVRVTDCEAIAAGAGNVTAIDHWVDLNGDVIATSCWMLLRAVPVMNTKVYMQGPCIQRARRNAASPLPARCVRGAV